MGLTSRPVNLVGRGPLICSVIATNEGWKTKGLATLFFLFFLRGLPLLFLGLRLGGGLTGGPKTGGRILVGLKGGLINLGLLGGLNGGLNGGLRAACSGKCYRTELSC